MSVSKVSDCSKCVAMKSLWISGLWLCRFDERKTLTVVITVTYIYNEVSPLMITKHDQWRAFSTYKTGWLPVPWHRSINHQSRDLLVFIAVPVRSRESVGSSRHSTWKRRKEKAHGDRGIAAALTALHATQYPAS